MLKVTSEQLRDGEVYAKIYNVADLVIPIPNFVPSTNMGLQGLINDAYGAMGYSGQGNGMAGPMAMVNNQMPGSSDAMTGNQVLAQQFGAPGSASGMNALTGGPGGMGGAANADFDSLMELITSTVERDSWVENGTGEGEIQPFPTNLSLVISQTQRVHEQIADLLEQLRRLQDLQVTIEVRFIRLSDSFFERIGVDFDFNIEDGTGLPTIDGIPNALYPGASYEPPRASATVGLDPTTGLADFPRFTANLDVPFRQESFGLSAPTVRYAGRRGLVRLCHPERHRSLLPDQCVPGRPTQQCAASSQSHAVQWPAGDYRRLVVRAVRDQRDPGRRRICGRPAAGDRGPLGRNHDDGAGGGFRESARTYG